jgi:NAD(P)-dependent dehydrogenase (short-subunit alcohol dehydrogenase family)
MANHRWTADKMPDMSGRVVVVTGASSGIGAITAGELARAGASVVLAVRDVAKGEAAATTMAGKTDVRQLDLTSLASIREFAAGWTGDLDILINNAGIMMVPEGRTADGFELQIGTNHLGHFALTNLLLPHITDRVVTVSSDLHKIGRINVGDLNWEHRKYRPLGAYSQSKLANLLFTFELQRRLTDSGSAVRAVAAHPGVAETNLISHVGGFQGAANKLLLAPITQDGQHGALPTLYAATQDIPGGSYAGPDGLIHTKGYPEVAKPSKASRNADLAKSLWAASARLTQTDFPALATRSG